MSGPTREELDKAREGAWREAMGHSCHDAACQCAEGRTCDHCLRRVVGAGLTAAEPLRRARHVREAVEGLPTAFTDSREFVRVCGHVMPRAALLAALTGEGT